MRKKMISCFFTGLFILAGSGMAKAAGHVPAMDTLPGNNKKPQESAAQKTDDVIKEVPKSRKQEKPLAVTPVNIKPVSVKPKVVVKTVIKVHL